MPPGAQAQPPPGGAAPRRAGMCVPGRAGPGRGGVTAEGAGSAPGSPGRRCLSPLRADRELPSCGSRRLDLFISL